MFFTICYAYIIVFIGSLIGSLRLMGILGPRYDFFYSSMRVRVSQKSYSYSKILVCEDPSFKTRIGIPPLTAVGMAAIYYHALILFI
jgi:hypothetical protein